MLGCRGGSEGEVNEGRGSRGPAGRKVRQQAGRGHSQHRMLGAARATGLGANKGTTEAGNSGALAGGGSRMQEGASEEGSAEGQQARRGHLQPDMQGRAQEREEEQAWISVTC
eukprot:755108-Hanusia_phi.AAC.2